jgi:hypothetical protein
MVDNYYKTNMKKTKLKPDVGIERFREINKYYTNLIFEQEKPLDPNAVPPLPPAGEAGAVPPPPPGEAGAVPPPPPDDAATMTPEDSTVPDETTPEDPTADDTTEEIDITDLVNMVKDVKKQMDVAPKAEVGVNEKMDGIFTKLNDLEAKLGEMDNVLAKIDQLGAEIEDVKPKTPVEKLEMRSLDSYPFNKKPDEFFEEKQEEMKKSGKNEYVLTKGDVENYSKYDVMKSFNPEISNNTQF